VPRHVRNRRKLTQRLQPIRWSTRRNLLLVEEREIVAALEREYGLAADAA